MTDYTDNKYFELFNKQKANQFAIGNTSKKERIKKLDTLQRALQYTYKQAIRDALYADFKKPFIETDLTEIYLVVKEIKHAKANLHKWLKKHKVSTPIALLGTSSYYIYEPKGVCLIISPWNYPVNLTFSPLVAAIAAGNTVIIKPSEMTPNTSKVMSDIVKSLFNENEVALVEGEVEVSKELLKLPFNHIFFTGSPTVGKIVMEAASKHLTSVTLELGGKSPVIIDASANLNLAAKTIIWIKFFNNGQTCIAPDYVYVHESIKTEFIELCKNSIVEFYNNNPENSNSYSRSVNEKHFKRLIEYLEDAKERGATIETGGDYLSEENYIAPTLISGLPEEADLLVEEIFGPILPIKTFKQIDEVIDYVNSKEKPLALYIYSRNNKNTDNIIKNTRAGTTAINNIGVQYINHNLPFGGSNNSGIGKAHGFFSFQEFSNQRGILKRYTTGPVSLLKPPYNKFVQKIVDITIKWF